MMIQKIESLTNPKVKQLSKLLDSSKERQKEGKFVLEGLRLCLDCVENSAIKAESVFFTDSIFKKSGALIQNAFADVPSFEITEAIAGKLARTESSQGIFLLCAIFDSSSPIDPRGKYIALENIQNPDNFGAICRCAEAFGLDGLIVSGGVDMFNPKALRAAMGSSLRLNIIKTAILSETILDFKKIGGRVFSAVPDRVAKSISDADLSPGAIVVVGNEANGVSGEISALCEKITIPMTGGAESLNAAAAAAIIAWELSK